MIKYLINLLIIFSFFSQTLYIKDIITDNQEIKEHLNVLEGKKINVKDLEALVYNILEADEADGRILSSLKISHINLSNDSISLFINYQKAAQWMNDSIIISGNNYTNSELIVRESRIKKNSLFKPSLLKNASKYLQNSPYTNELKSYKFFQDSINKKNLVLEIDEKENFFINTIVGYRPATKGLKSLFTAEIDLKLENISGTGRAIDFSWKRQDSKNDLISIRYFEPALFNFPVHGTYTLFKELSDSVFTKWRHDFEFQYQINSYFNIKYMIGFEKINPSDSNKINQNRVPFSNGIRNEISLLYQNLNRYQNPLDGIYINLRISNLNRSITGPDWLLQKDSLNSSFKLNELSLEQRLYYSLADYIVLYNKSVFSYSDSKKIFFNDYHRLGGSKNIRGFLNEQFRAKNLFYNNFELRLVNSERERLFFFHDFAFFTSYPDERTKKLGSYGFGLRLDNKYGIFGLDIALEYGKAFNNAVFHFTISSKLSD